MNLQDLKDQFSESLRQTGQKIQESSVYLFLQERYQLLSPTVQKVVLVATALLIAFVLLIIPMSLLQTASESIESFEDNKTLASRFMRVQREFQQGPQIPPALSTSRLRSRISSSLKNAGLLEEQIKSTQDTQLNIKKWVKPGVEYDGLTVSVSQLNLTQVTDVGYSLQNLARSVKLLNMKVQVHPEDDHYFDVDYELANYRVPIEPDPTPEPKGRKGKRSRRSRSTKRRGMTRGGS